MVQLQRAHLDASFAALSDATRRGILERLGHADASITDLAAKWLEENRDSDFFLWVHYYDPHIPYTPPREYIAKDAVPDGAVGYAYTRDRRQLAKFQATFPVIGCCFVEARTLAAADRRVHTTDHEIGHILCDMFHFAGRHPELMTDEAVDLVNSVGASKRLSHRSLPHQAIIGRDAGGTFTRSAPVYPVEAARTLENPAFIEAWPRRRSP